MQELRAIRLLEALNEATDVFPPLKSAVGGVLHIAKLVKVRLSLKYPPLRDLLVRRKYSGISLEQKAWTQFAEHIQKSVALVAQALADQHANSTSRILDDGLKELNKCVICLDR